MKLAIALASSAVVAIGLVAHAQAPASFKRTVLQQADISVPGREVVQAAVEFQPNGTPGRHTHPGEEVGYVVDGTVKVEIDGKPAMTLTAGQAFLIPANTIHNATNVGTTNAHLVATYIVEKGKPLATPAPTSK